MRAFFLSLALVLFGAKGFSQAAQIISESDQHIAHALERIADSIYVAGFAYNPTSGSEDLFVSKVNHLNAVEWTVTYGGNLNDGGNNVLIKSYADTALLLSGRTLEAGATYGYASLFMLDLQGQKNLGTSLCVHKCFTT